jgi:hypothetical protein
MIWYKRGLIFRIALLAELKTLSPWTADISLCNAAFNNDAAITHKIVREIGAKFLQLIASTFL